MSKIAGVVLVVLMALAGAVSRAQDTPAAAEEAGARDARQTQRRRLRDLTPEQREQLRQKWQNMSAEERAQWRAKMRARSGEGKAAPAELRQRAAATQAARLKSRHEATVGELAAIRKLALEENAPRTAERLAQLISRHEQQYAKQLAAMEKKRVATGDNAAVEPPEGRKARNQSDRQKRRGQTNRAVDNQPGREK